MRWRLFVAVALVAHLGAFGCSGTLEVDDRNEFSESIFAEPPDEYGPQTRWWWPGASVDNDGIEEELQRFARLGYRGVEIQPFMSAITNAALDTDSRIRGVGDDVFLGHLQTAACTARDLGLSWDLTLGSGWSTGGTTVGDDGSRQLLMAELDLGGPATFEGELPEAREPDWVDDTNGILPAVDGFDDDTSLVAVLAAELLDTDDSPAVLGDVLDLTSRIDGTTLTWDVPPGPHRVFAIYENRTRHFPVAHAYPGALEDARVIDHLDPRGIETFLADEFGAWIEAVEDCPPAAVFVDSFELVGELPWTTSFGPRFEAAVGYDVAPFLPFLFLEGGESEYTNIFGDGPLRYRATDDRGARAREDYEAFRGALFADEMISVLRDWLALRGIALRLQAHGGYADVLDAYALANVPESEGLYGGGSYDFLRLAASAAEVSGRDFASSETLVSVGESRLTEQEARLLIGKAFSAGINRLVYHGNAYRYVQPGDERWFPFRPLPDSAVTTGPLELSFELRPDTAFFSVLRAINRMAARLSYALSRGEAISQIAWLYPEIEADNFPNSGVEPGAFESPSSQALRRAGFNYARVSRSELAASSSEDGALTVGASVFEVLLVDDLEVAEPTLLDGIQRAVDAGVPVIWHGELAARAPGLADAETRDGQVARSIAQLESSLVRVDAPEAIPEAVRQAGIAPTLTPVDGESLGFSVLRRRITGADLYFVFNESFDARTERLGIVGDHGEVRLLDPDTGDREEDVVNGDVVTVSLDGAEGALLWVERPN